MKKKDWRFERCARLLGLDGMRRLENSHVAVLGLGGVGSYAVEGLARSGLGHLTIVDYDGVCVTNINRQLQAFPCTVGRSKADLMAAHVRSINPCVDLRVINEFYNKDTSSRFLEISPDIVIDCIDNVTSKMHLVATCIEKRIPIIVTLGAAAKVDPTRIRTVPLTQTHTDPLGRALRKHIRRKYDVTDEQLAGVVAVFSDEPVIRPSAEHGGIMCGVNCECPGGGLHLHKKRSPIYGSAVFVTSVFGMAAASAATRILLGMDPFSIRITCDVCGNTVDPTKSIKDKKKR